METKLVVYLIWIPIIQLIKINITNCLTVLELKMKDLSRIFMKISSEKGNKFANGVIEQNTNDKVKSFLDENIEFISVNLQAEFNRITCTPLGQLKTREIGNKIKEIIEDHSKRIIYFIERENERDKNLGSFIKNYFAITLNNLYNKIINTNLVKKELVKVQEMNLLLDFSKIIDIVCDFDVNTVDRIFKYLIIVNLHRRIVRRGNL